MLPPKSLFVGLLPTVRCDKTIVYTLCKSCAEEGIQNEPFCQHSIPERCIRGCFFSEELKFAIEHGYKIIKIYEIWHFKKTSTTLFSAYFQEFLRLKMISTKLTVDQDVFIAEAKAKLGINLEGEVFEPEETMKATSKILLNALWVSRHSTPIRPKVTVML